MTEKDLIKKLHNLREIKADAEWLKSNRDLLFSQISNSGAKEISPWSSFVINFTSLAKTVSMPAMALGSFLILILVTSIFSHQLLMNAKPNQSLYIARVISEKARLNTILNTESRDKMAAQFAASHAQDIITVLSDPTITSNEQEVAKLNESFKEEIKTVQKSIAKVNKPVATTNIATASEEVFSATALKDDQGVSINMVASTTSEKILEDATNSFDKKDYAGASKALELIK
ncbi:MAG: hypothetical protein WAW11_05265 [Patescibacteria group bacterium]